MVGVLCLQGEDGELLGCRVVLDAEGSGLSCALTLCLTEASWLVPGCRLSQAVPGQLWNEGQST